MWEQFCYGFGLIGTIPSVDVLTFWAGIGKITRWILDSLLLIFVYEITGMLLRGKK